MQFCPPTAFRIWGGCCKNLAVPMLALPQLYLRSPTLLLLLLLLLVLVVSLRLVWVLVLKLVILMILVVLLLVVVLILLIRESNRLLIFSHETWSEGLPCRTCLMTSDRHSAVKRGARSLGSSSRPKARLLWRLLDAFCSSLCLWKLLPTAFFADIFPQEAVGPAALIAKSGVVGPILHFIECRGRKGVLLLVGDSD